MWKHTQNHEEDDEHIRCPPIAIGIVGYIALLSFASSTSSTFQQRQDVIAVYPCTITKEWQIVNDNYTIQSWRRLEWKCPEQDKICSHNIYAACHPSTDENCWPNQTMLNKSSVCYIHGISGLYFASEMSTASAEILYSFRILFAIALMYALWTCLLLISKANDEYLYFEN